MSLLLSADTLNRLCQTHFPSGFAYWQPCLRFVSRLSPTLPITAQFQQLATACEALELPEQRKAWVSEWQKNWLGSFILHWVWLLHAHQIEIVLNARAIGRADTGENRFHTEIDVGYCVFKRAETPDAQLAAYRRLKSFFVEWFSRLHQLSGLNETVFWHNCANWLEFALSILKTENYATEAIYTQLFLNKKWDDYEYSPFYHVVEYIDFPALPLPPPVRFRKVCCHLHLNPQYDYCANCPKLKKLPPNELQAFVKKWFGS